MFIHPALHMNSRLSGAFPGGKEKEEKRMKLSENEYQNYTAILRAELIPAMGCTEPIAIAYAAAEDRCLKASRSRSVLWTILSVSSTMS